MQVYFPYAAHIDAGLNDLFARRGVAFGMAGRR
jgi:hypothetical protein